MSGVFGALFSGKAATETDDTMREWRKLFQTEEQLELEKQRLELQGRQLEQAVTLQEDSQSHAERLAQLQNDAAQGRLDDQQAFDAGKLFVDSLKSGNYNVAEMEAQMPEMARIAPDLAPAMRLYMNQGLYSDPQKALTVVDTFTNDLTSRPSWESLEAAYTSIWQRSGLSRDDQAERLEEVRAEWEFRGTQKAGEREAGVAAALLVDDQARATLASTEAGTDLKVAQTAQVGASTAKILQDIDQSDDIHPFMVQQHAATADLYTQQAIQEEMETGIYPEQLAAKLNETLERTETHELANDLSRATFEDAVLKFASETGLSVENARHAVATGAWRDLAKKNELDRGLQMLELLTGQTEGQLLLNQQTGMTMLNDLVEKGNPEMVEALGSELLGHFPNLADEDRQEILDMAVELASGNRVTAGHLEALDVKVKEAQARREEADAGLAEFKLENAPEQLEFDNWAKAEGLRIQRQNADIYARAVAGQYPERDPNAPVTGAALHGDVRDELGYSFGDIRDRISEYHTALADLEMLQAGADTGVVPTDLQTKYNIRDVETLKKLLQNRVDNLRQGVEGDITGYLATGFGLSGGYTFSARELGLEDDDPFYLSATQNLPWIRRQDAEESVRVTEVNDRVHTLINEMSGVFGPDGASLLGAAAVYDVLLEEFGQGRLNEAGYDNPSEFRDSLTGAAQEYSANSDIADNAMEQLDAFGVANVPNNFGGRQTGQQVYRSFIHAADSIREQVMQWDSGGMLGMGRDNQTGAQLASSILSISPEGSYTTLVELGVISPDARNLGDKKAVLAYLETYISNANTNIQALQFMNLRNPE